MGISFDRQYIFFATLAALYIPLQNWLVSQSVAATFTGQLGPE